MSLHVIICPLPSGLTDLYLFKAVARHALLRSPGLGAPTVLRIRPPFPEAKACNASLQAKELIQATFYLNAPPPGFDDRQEGVGVGPDTPSKT